MKDKGFIVWLGTTWVKDHLAVSQKLEIRI